MPLHTPRADLLVAGAAVALLAPLARLHAQAGDVTGRVTQAGSDEPIAGATVAVTGQRRGAITRGDGTYRITLPAGQYELAARLIGYTAVKANVTVAAGGTVTQNFQLTRAASVLSAVAVTGSRRATERSVTEAPVPIDVVTSAEIKQTGRTETSQILQMLVPSVNFPRTSIAGGVDMQRPFTLRGLGPDQALVLINGKRRHAGAVVAVNNSIGRGSTGVDLNAIPAASIARIEVLRDGAAAQYGSDAIGGVINIILKEDAPASISATVGQVNSSLNAPPLGALRYNDGGVVQLDANKGWDFGGGRGFLNLTAEARDRGATSRNLPDQRPQYWTAATDDSVRRGLPVTIGGVRVPEAAVDFSRNNFWYGDAAIRDGGGFWNAGYKPGRGIEVYSFGGATYRVGRSFGFSRRPAEPVVVRSLHPQGFLPSIVGTSQDVSGAVGAKGRAAGWAWDVSGTVGQNRFAFDVNNSNNPTLGNASPRDFYAGTLRSTQMTYNADASRQFAVGLAAPVNVGVGAEARFDRYAIARGDTASWIDGGQAVLDGPQRGARVPGGSQLFYGFKPSDVVNATRESQAAYVDVEVTPVNRLQLGAAGRFENFSDFGQATIGKLTARFEPVKGYALRAAANTGFRAPSLAQTYYSSTASNVLVVGGVPTPNEVATLPVTSPAARALGATDLQPERSRNFGAGITLTPNERLSVTADWFGINIADRIVLSETFVGPLVRTIIQPFGLQGDIRPRFFTNAIDTRTRGLDLVARYARDLGNETSLRSTASFNRSRTRITRVSATPPQLQALNLPLLGRVERSRIEEAQPWTNFRVNVSYLRRQWSADVQQARFGSYWSRPDLGVPVGTRLAVSDQQFSPRWVTDASVTRRFEQLSLTLGADNLFDVYPDRLAATNPEIFGGTRMFSPFSPFGANGRFVFVRASYTP
jgi:iron complex outermembrane receptor protein